MIDRQSRSTKTLSRHELLPSMLMVMPLSCNRPVKAVLVNWLPRSVLKVRGMPCRSSAYSTASMQKLTSMLIESRQASTLRLNQSKTAAG